MSSHVIAIDGPAYVGKSEIAKALSRLTGYAYINTGHMYRAVAKKTMDSHFNYDHRESIMKLAKKMQIEFIRMGSDWRTVVDQADWTDRLNDPDIVLFSSKIAVIPELRVDLTAKQRRLAKKQMIIMEGRDIGSVVFPDAQWKFFVTANEDVRASRLWKTLNDEEKRMNSDFKTWVARIRTLDGLDKDRKIAPLIVPENAITYDNSGSPNAEEDAGWLKRCMDHPECIPPSKTIYYSEDTSAYGIHR